MGYVEDRNERENEYNELNSSEIKNYTSRCGATTMDEYYDNDVQPFDGLEYCDCKKPYCPQNGKFRATNHSGIHRVFLHHTSSDK